MRWLIVPALLGWMLAAHAVVDDPARPPDGLGLPIPPTARPARCVEVFALAAEQPWELRAAANGDQGLATTLRKMAGLDPVRSVTVEDMEQLLEELRVPGMRPYEAIARPVEEQIALVAISVTFKCLVRQYGEPRTGFAEKCADALPAAIGLLAGRIAGKERDEWVAEYRRSGAFVSQRMSLDRIADQVYAVPIFEAWPETRSPRWLAAGWLGSCMTSDTKR